MANAEHLKILEQGVEVWNAWRVAHEADFLAGVSAIIPGAGPEAYDFGLGLADAIVGQPRRTATARSECRRRGCPT